MLTEIERRLDDLNNMKMLRDAMAAAYEQAKSDVVPMEVKKYLADVETEYASIFSEMDAKIAAVEAEVKAAVAKHGQTVSAGGADGAVQPWARDL